MMAGPAAPGPKPAVGVNSNKLKENARRTLKLSIPKLQMAEQQQQQKIPPPRKFSADIIQQSEEQMARNDAISAMFLSATTPQSVKTVSPSSGTGTGEYKFNANGRSHKLTPNYPTQIDRRC